jgi:hypothetical protein
VFSAPITFICKYDTYSDGDRNSKVEEDFILTFIDDRENKKAYILGNVATEEVNLIPNVSGSISYIEITGTGNVMTTTIDINGESVHSRNTTILGELVPSQYYGTCITKE